MKTDGNIYTFFKPNGFQCWSCYPWICYGGIGRTSFQCSFTNPHSVPKQALALVVAHLSPVKAVLTCPSFWQHYFLSLTSVLISDHPALCVWLVAGPVEVCVCLTFTVGWCKCTQPVVRHGNVQGLRLWTVCSLQKSDSVCLHKAAFISQHMRSTEVVSLAMWPFNLVFI